ncbi:MAG TPA: hypothetical protein VGS07_10875 [Thermoanaerobaculia bacterium]|nr:hypothetical protein [Thermoanaerobaculia bacterium]
MDPAIRKRVLRTVVSLLSTIAGWAASVFYYTLYMRLAGRSAGMGFFWPGIVIVLGWSFLFQPLLYWLPAEHPLFAPRVFPFIGIALAVVAFHLSFAAWGSGPWSELVWYFLYAAIAGGVAALLYSLANRVLLRQERTI